MNAHRPKPYVLLILDGFGYSQAATDNAISNANAPVWQQLWRQQPHTLLKCSGPTVGLPEGQMGNSEVGHLHLGCGRLLAQDFARVNDAVADHSFATNTVLRAAADRAATSNKALHILGLLSPGGVHSHEAHLHAMVRLAAQRGVQRIFLHAFLDGRDTPPRSAETSLRATQAVFAECGRGRIASMIGRYYAMDRDNRWERVQQAFDLLVEGVGQYRSDDPVAALHAAYARGESDEFIAATTIAPEDGEPCQIEDGDVVVFMNFRADRTRQLTRALTEPGFSAFARRRVPQLGEFVTLTEYHADFPFPVAFPPTSLANSLGEILAKQHLRQLRLAETEKYAHVTFFFNGGIEQPFPGETRILVPSPLVQTYDLQPEMSAVAVTDTLVDAIDSGKYDVIICNYANCDMVGHTGILSAAIKAVEAIDRALERVIAALERNNGELLVTADHGNCEQMLDPVTGQPHTAHTTNPVPLVYWGKRPLRLADHGNLADVAPTLLALMGIPKPAEMTGCSLLIETAKNHPVWHEAAA